MYVATGRAVVGAFTDIAPDAPGVATLSNCLCGGGLRVGSSGAGWQLWTTRSALCPLLSRLAWLVFMRDPESP